MTEEVNKSPLGTIIPEIKLTKNGYEIRSDILSLTVDFVKWEYEMKFRGSSRVPPTPTLDDIIESAKRLNEFVCASTTFPKQKEK